MTSEEKQTKDRTRIEKLKENGYDVLILWEDEITKFPDKTKEKIYEILRNR
jgi:very-short-patch-repair endonuclease